VAYRAAVREREGAGRREGGRQRKKDKERGISESESTGRRATVTHAGCTVCAVNVAVPTVHVCISTLKCNTVQYSTIHEASHPEIVCPHLG
jgi:hypothetical protein